MDNHSRRLIDKMRYKRQLDQLLGAVKKAIIVSHKFDIYEVDMSFTSSSYFEFRVYRKGETSDILMWETLEVGRDEFDEKFKGVGYVLNHLLQNGIMPDIYNFYLKNSDNDSEL